MNHFYVAVDRKPLKLVTLLELLEVLARNVPGLPMAIFCSSRDVLDDVLEPLLSMPSLTVVALFSDQSEGERSAVLQHFNTAVQQWQPGSLQTGSDQLHSVKLQVLVTTDSCAPPLQFSPGEQPLQSRLLINFDIPQSKEVYSRRIASCFGSAAAAAFLKSASASGATNSSQLLASESPPGIGGQRKPTSLFCVSALEISSLRSLEEAVGQEISEMPIHFCELLASK